MPGKSTEKNPPAKKAEVFQPIKLDLNTTVGLACLDMVNILRSLNVPLRVQREAAYYFCTGYANRKIRAANKIE